MNTVVKAERLEKVFETKGNRVPVLRSVSLDIRKGEFLAIMGPSGSGKSTLLYSLSGMDRISRGSVSFRGLNLNSLSEKELSRLRLHQMGFIFQQIHLLKNLTIRDNIMAAALLAGRHRRSEIQKKADSLMARTGISELKGNDISQASGGQLQRAAICRALINEPEILFGDEPTGALNSRSAREIMDILTELNRTGMTIMLVTHDVKVASRTGRVLFMKDGVIAGEYVNDSAEGLDNVGEREKKLSDWLSRQGF